MVIARSAASVPWATAQPSFSAPIRCPTGTNTSSKNSSQKSAEPVACAIGRTSMPGECMSTTRQLMPLCFGTSGSVRTRSMHQSAANAQLVHTFCPVTT